MTLTPERADADGPGLRERARTAGRTLGRPLRRLRDRIPARLRMPLGVGLLALVGYLLWWAAFYPGLMTYDSFTYTWEATTGHWIDDHSIFYLSCVWLSLRLTGDYALLTLCQVLGMSAAIGYLAAGLRKFRVRTGWIVAAVVLLLVLPSSGDFVVYVWKDVPYVIGGVLAFAALTHLAADLLRGPRPRRKDGSRGRRRGARRDWLLLGTGFTLVCLSRNNGFLAVLISGAVLLLCLPWLWRRILPAALIPVLIFVGLDRGLYPALGVTQPADYAANTFVYADIGYVYATTPQVFSAADKELLSRVAPLQHWKTAGADCYGVDALSRGLDKAAAVAHHDQLMALFLKTLRTSPAAVARVTICRGTPAWAVNPAKDRTFVMDVRSSPNGYTFMNGHPELYASPYYPSMHVRPLSDTLHHTADWWYNLGKTPQLNWIVWNGATWCWLGYLVVLRLAHRLRRREVLALTAVTVGAQLTVFVATPAPLFRYMATPFFVGVLSLPLLFSRRDREEPG